MKGLGALLLLPGWDASLSQDTQHKVTKSNQSRTLDPELWRVNYEVITTRINFRSFSNAQAKSAFQTNSLFYIGLLLY